MRKSSARHPLLLALVLVGAASPLRGAPGAPGASSVSGAGITTERSPDTVASGPPHGVPPPTVAGSVPAPKHARPFA
jgi:hypothetical protein